MNFRAQENKPKVHIRLQNQTVFFYELPLDSHESTARKVSFQLSSVTLNTLDDVGAMTMRTRNGANEPDVSFRPTNLPQIAPGANGDATGKGKNYPTFVCENGTK